MLRRPWGWVAAAGVAAIAAVTVWSIGGFREQQRWALLETYCTDCHNPLDLAGDLSFEGLTPESVPQHAEVFEAAIKKLRGRLMPPPGARQPEQEDVDALIAWLERSIDEGAEYRTVGHVAAQRLNRTELSKAVQDLLDVEIDATEYLPTEIEVDGFTNIAAALSASPAFVEQYLEFASAAAHLAVGEPVPKTFTAYFPPPAGGQDGYIEGMPLGTRGGTKIVHTFPADGEYRLTIKDVGVGLYPTAVETRHTLVVLVDREVVFREDIGGPEDFALANKGGAPGKAEIESRFADIPLYVKAGTHEIVVTFIHRSHASTDEMISTFSPRESFSYNGAPRVPRIAGGIDLTGPIDSTGLSATPSRRKIFVCEPEVPERERACAEQITATLAERAYRRPIDQADLDRLMPFFEEGRSGPGGFDEGIEVMITALLSSPDFLYRFIAPPKDPTTDRYALGDFELASRLAFFLWSQGPDDELLKLAADGKLSRPDVLDAQVMRMLADPRAEVLVDDFALRWLNVDDLNAVQPDQNIFPEFSESLRRDFAEEIRLFLGSILLEDRDVRELLTASHTFLNERLARHYGVAGVFGPQFRRVELDDPRRHGLLGKGAVLLRTSYGDRTSPVLRGAWVLEKLMGTPPAPPPPGVETDLTTKAGEQPKTLRARLEQHRADSVCSACHGVIDPYGLALENFTVIGAWRDYDKDADAPIDASTVLPGGISVTGPVELTAALLRREDQFVQALTQKLMMYALGRELEYFDMPEVREIVRAARSEDYRFSALVRGIVRSEAFRMQGVVRDDATIQASVARVSASAR
ncbi:MAG TPA: DUF1592 domain-containing protein [Gammaproteobacteria bacterium]